MRLLLTTILFALCINLPAQPYKLVVTVVDSLGVPLENSVVTSSQGDAAETSKDGVARIKYNSKYDHLGDTIAYEIQNPYYPRIGFKLLYADTAAVYKTVVMRYKRQPFKCIITIYDYLKDPDFAYAHFTKQAWEKKDTAMLGIFAEALYDTMDIKAFYNRLVEFDDVTGFWYGNADTSEIEFWTETTTKTRRIRMHNIAAVHKLYVKSCLVFKPIDINTALTIQDKYWQDNSYFTEDELKTIANALDALCK